MLPLFIGFPALVKLLVNIAHPDHRKGEIECRSRAHFGFYPYLAARASHNFFAGGQSQTAAGFFFGAALQRKENSVFPFVFDSNSVVFYGEDAARAFAPPCDSDLGWN